MFGEEKRIRDRNRIRDLEVDVAQLKYTLCSMTGLSPGSLPKYSHVQLGYLIDKQREAFEDLLKHLGLKMRAISSETHYEFIPVDKTKKG